MEYYSIFEPIFLIIFGIIYIICAIKENKKSYQELQNRSRSSIKQRINQYYQ